MGCGASIDDSDFKDRTINGNQTSNDYELKLRASLIQKFDRPDDYENVNMNELVLQSENQHSKVENFVDQGYRWKKDFTQNVMGGASEEKQREDRIKLRRIHELASGLRLANDNGVTLLREDAPEAKALPLHIQMVLLERLAEQRLKNARTPEQQEAARAVRYGGLKKKEKAAKPTA